MQAFYFTAPWCVPCRTFGPVMEQVDTVPVHKIDVDREPRVAQMYGVMSVPTVVLVAEEQELGRFSGARDLSFVKNFISSHS